MSEILSYAKKDKDLLRKQIDILDPQIVICCGTFDCYDVIYDYTYGTEEKLINFKNCSCWRVDKRLVIDFYHPSYWVKGDRNLYEILCHLLHDGSTQKHLKAILGTK